MHAYLLVADDEPAINKKVKEISGKNRIIRFKLEKIADTRELVRQTNMSLFEPTVYVLDIDNASIEAQNAFLKRLEEPAEDLTFVLVAQNEAKVLPTILSRCQIIRLKSKRVTSGSVSEITFSEISKITKREDAIAYLENLINSLHDKLPKNARALRLADDTLSRIKANANPTLQLTRLAVSLQ